MAQDTKSAGASKWDQIPIDGSARVHIHNTISHNYYARQYNGDILDSLRRSHSALADAYDSNGQRQEYVLEQLLDRQKHLLFNMNERMDDLRHALFAQEGTRLDPEADREYNGLMSCCDVLSVSIAARGNPALRAARSRTYRASSLPYDVSELLRLNDLTEKLLEPLASATASLQSADKTFVFDEELFHSPVYKHAEEPGNYEQDTDPKDLEQTTAGSETVSSKAYESARSFPTADTSWRGSAYAGSQSPHALRSYAEVELLLRDRVYPTTVLLDTGADADCVSTRLLELLELESTKAKHRKAKTFRLGNRSTVTSTHGVKIRWRFKSKKPEYHILFSIVDNLSHDLILSKHSIFDFDFLFENQEICVLGLPEHLRGDFENLLAPLGLPKLSMVEAEEQEKRVDDDRKAKEAAEAAEDAEIAREAEEKRRKVEQHRQGGSSSQGQSSGSGS